MDAFTMVIIACVSGEPTCSTKHLSEMSFNTVEACETRIDDIARSMTRELGKQSQFKGRQVTYDVSCMNRTQLAQKFGITQSDT